jgi:hypothetical protein
MAKGTISKNCPTASERILIKIQRFHAHCSAVLLFQNPFKEDTKDVDELQMEVTKLQTTDSLRNAFEPSDLRILYSGLPSEVFPKIRKFKLGMMTVLPRKLSLLLNFRKNVLFQLNK